MAKRWFPNCRLYMKMHVSFIVVLLERPSCMFFRFTAWIFDPVYREIDNNCRISNPY